MPRITIDREETKDPVFLEDSDGPFLVSKEQLSRWELAHAAWQEAKLEMQTLLEEHEKRVWAERRSHREI